MRANRPLVLLVALSAAAGGCGIANQSSPVVINHASLPPARSTTSLQRAPTSIPVTLYFVNANNLLVKATHSEAYQGINAAVNALLAGPNSQESSAGVTSAIPASTKLLSVSIQGTIVELNFSNALASVSGNEQLLAFAQIVATATTLPGVDTVQIAITGQSVNAPLPDGTLAQGPVAKANYASLLASLATKSNSLSTTTTTATTPSSTATGAVAVPPSA